jgi:hypothetical protein
MDPLNPEDRKLLRLMLESFFKPLGANQAFLVIGLGNDGRGFLLRMGKALELDAPGTIQILRCIADNYGGSEIRL